MIKLFSPALRNWLIFYFILILIYSIISYGLTTPDLTLINADWFATFQRQMWGWFFNNRPFLTLSFGIIFSLLVLCWLRILSLANKTSGFSVKKQITLIFLLSAPLLLSYNALSHDVFNYIFNSRMVLEYQANPHVKTALDFSFDPWTRFMHNIHTEAPYGYGWTGISLIPYFLGFEKFFLTWMNFRVFSLLSLILSSVVITKTHRLIYGKEISFFNWALFFLNPLILIEIISNTHNDLWMMVPAVAGMNLILKARTKKNKSFLIGAGLLLLTISISIKLATLALLPIFAILIIYALWAKKFNFLSKKRSWLMLAASLLMFLPLLTDRSQQFHPWYLSWPLIFIPVIKHSWWKIALIAFSITSLLRYLPWLYYNDYSPEILQMQKSITWSAALVPLLYFLVYFAKHRFHGKKIK